MLTPPEAIAEQEQEHGAVIIKTDSKTVLKTEAPPAGVSAPPHFLLVSLRFPYPSPCLTALIFFTLFFFHRTNLIASPDPMPSAAFSISPSELASYDQLIRAIQNTRAQSRLRLAQQEREAKLREAWTIGKLIDQHVLQQRRADYDKEVVLRLSRDLDISDSELYRMLKFARAYPKVAPGPELSWAHYRQLITIENEGQREALAVKAEENELSREELRDEMKKVKAQPASLTLPPVKPGKLNTFRVIRAKAGPDEGEMVLDLGFSNYYRPDKRLIFEENSVVELVTPGNPNTRAKLRVVEAPQDADLYTYQAFLIKVIDGDTIWAVMNLGYGVRTVQKLRLKGIDAPEAGTLQGIQAQQFVQDFLNPSAELQESAPENRSSRSVLPGPPQAFPGAFLVRTFKSDKYDRYLADLWVRGEYLNQKLVDEGLAVIVED